MKILDFVKKIRKNDFFEIFEILLRLFQFFFFLKVSYYFRILNFFVLEFFLLFFEIFQVFN
jgi:hypothetical protein